MDNVEHAAWHWHFCLVRRLSSRQRERESGLLGAGMGCGEFKWSLQGRRLGASVLSTSWSEQRCIRVNCRLTQAVQCSMLQYVRRISIGDRCTYKCQSTYRPVAESTECNANSTRAAGNWSMSPAIIWSNNIIVIIIVIKTRGHRMTIALAVHSLLSAAVVKAFGRFFFQNRLSKIIFRLICRIKSNAW